MQSLVNIAQSISSEKDLENVPAKTKILMINLWMLKKPLFYHIDPSAVTVNIGGVPVAPVSEATHLGILRSCSFSSNFPAIMLRISSHTRALYGILHAGMAKNYQRLPGDSLRILNIFCAPILFSSLAPLLLSSHEISVISTCEDNP